MESKLTIRCYQSLYLVVMLCCIPATLNAQAKMKDAYYCANLPLFIETVGLQQPVAIDTQQLKFPGIVIRELQGNRRIYRHPTWNLSGHVARTVRDSKGHIYAVPVPTIGLDTNPLEARNTVYRIDSVSGEMSAFLKLPLGDNNSQSNPFGAMGLTVDCDTNSLYVSSVANSTPLESKGIIYKINLLTAKVESKLTGVDALGLGLFDVGDGKRLYYGDARSSSVYSLPLLRNGHFSTFANPRHEFSLFNIRNGDSTQVRKIQFVADQQYGFRLVATDTEFSYRLLAESNRQFRNYDFTWNASLKKWQLLQIRPSL